MKIIQGYSKDHRPDLKQAVLAIITAQRSAIPLWIEAVDGNIADVSSMPIIIEAFRDQLQGEEEPLFVMDAAFYSADNIARNEEVRWLCRVPDSLKEVRALYTTAHERTWQHTEDENYRFQESTSEYGEVKQRWLLVHSAARQQRQEQTLLKRLKKERKDADKALSALSRRTFACQPDAEEAVAQLVKRWPHHGAEVSYTSKGHYEQAGRPSKGSEPSRLTWKVHGVVVETPESVAASRSKLGMYVLGSNELDTVKASSSSLLSLYRSQGGSVERGFRFLKDPMFFAGGVYLKKPERVMALLMVMTLGLLIYSLAEKHLRTALLEKNETLPDQKGKPTQRLTMRRVFQLFEGIDVLSIQLGENLQQQILNFTDLHDKIVQLLPIGVKSIYSLQGGCGR